jgi:hypothetical protein
MVGRKTAKLKSREALTLARELVDELLEADHASWRRRWLAAMASVRTVYDVLQDVDKTDQRLRAYVEPVLAKHVDIDNKQPDILFYFIKKAANGVLHRFQIAVADQHSVHIDTTGMTFTGAPRETPLITNSPKFTITKGPLRGQDGRTLLIEACRWLDMLLTEIEASLVQDGSTNQSGLSATPTGG